MNEQLFVKLVMDWITYEKVLQKMEEVGFSLTPEHPMWIMSNEYVQMICERFNLSEELFREKVEPFFGEYEIEDAKEYILKMIH